MVARDAGGGETRTYWEGEGLVLLWASVLLAPSALMLDIGIGYPLAKWVCASGQTGVLVLIAGASLMTTAVGVWLGSAMLQRVRSIATDDGGRQVDRSYFLALLGISLNILSALAIIAAAISQLVLKRCE